ncbi:gluconate 2-dehydrogenase subunit 3 family protein [Virgibacillus alimentarius]|uniref:Gluconate 2-dehydrogenase gamma chain n=1 Tax=Virgibacillus alimentarius TaxID=698769 RepID=A0ABS4S6V0_9BACI|nr:gluconate 2-dehydrogenase subunit 3 family protein [Virgibacillus alimentarius]MBP2256715.1 gluconate 2-dehydrogenase gamma chain [Virgibacillus alimentarius]
MDKDNNKEKSEQERLSRRRFIKNSSIAVGGLAAGGVIGSAIPWRKETKKDTQTAPQTDKSYNRALMNFTKVEFDVINDAAERIFPKDDHGPGAKDLGVAYYIDHQLAGSYGFNARDYMEPPFFHGEEVQGYQGRLKRREIFKFGIREMQNYSHEKHDKGFTDLSDEQQDGVLEDFEQDKVKLATISPSGFFNLLRSMTLEGLYSDPLYGGNINMGGWKMRDYPGDVMSYKDIIEKDFQKIEPTSLQDHM